MNVPIIKYDIPKMKIENIKMIFVRFVKVSAIYHIITITPVAIPIWIVVNDPNSTADSPNSILILGSINENKFTYQCSTTWPNVIQYKKLNWLFLIFNNFNV